MSNSNARGLRRLGVAAAALCVASTAWAGSVTYDFTTDPQADPDLFFVTSANDQPWVDAGGNPGGFLGLTWSVGSLYTGILFPDIDPGKIVTAFNFKCDIRTGNGSGERVADGFSVSFARSGDPVIEALQALDPGTAGYAGGIPEGGTTSGIAVSFDTWSGNTLPDTADIEGILVRVDNVTVARVELNTRNGACADDTSLQTGPRTPDHWAGGGSAYDAVAFESLCWQPFEINLAADGKLTVSWKGRKILDAYQTEFFPSAGQIVFAGRTGGSNGQCHIDNLQLTTTAVESSGPPPVPTGLAASATGSRRVALTWQPAVMPDGSRVAYELSRGGTVIAGTLLEPGYVDLDVRPGVASNYSLRARNLAGEFSAAVTLTVNPPAEVANLSYTVARIYRGLTGATQADLDTALTSEKWPNSPDSTRYVSGLLFGAGGGDTFGDNHLTAVSAVLSVPTAGQYRFFLKSDDASRFFINTAGIAIPDPLTDVAVAQEDGCCGPYEEPGAGFNDVSQTYPTSEPITLAAGGKYGVLLLVKEGGGGDWGDVAWRREGDTTPANQLVPLRGALIEGMGDPLGAAITFTQQPADSTIPAYQPVTFTVATSITSPYTTNTVYQWYKNDAVINGANLATYRVALPAPTDDGAKYKVQAFIPGLGVMSSEATLTVTANLPVLVSSVTGSESFNQATVTFNQPVVAPSATALANYAFSGGLTVSAATLVDPFNVRLTTSAQTPGTDYNLTVNGVQNLGGLAAANASAVLQSWRLVPGRARADQYNGFTGAGQGDMDTALSSQEWFDQTPSVVRYLPGMTFGEPAFGNTWGDNFMVAIRAILRPTQAGQYRFFVRSDDASRIYVNPSGAAIPDPLTATPVAQENGCCGPFEEPGAANNGDDTFPTSEPITLAAGQDYGILLLVKEGGGGDWGQAAWRREGDTTAANTLAPLTSMVWWYGPPVVTEIEVDDITVAGGNVTITYSTGTLQSAPSVTGPWTDVAGATSPFTTPATGGGMFYRLSQ